MNHDHAAARLLALLDGELSTAEATAVEAHVAACAECQAELAALRRTADRLRHALRPGRLSDAERARLTKAARGRPATARVATPFAGKGRPRVPWAIRIAAALLLPLLAALVWNERRQPTSYATVVARSELVSDHPGALQLEVREPSGQRPLAGAQVQAWLASSGGKRWSLGTWTTGTDGVAAANFAVPAVPPGRYQLELESRSDGGVDRVVQSVDVRRAATLLVSTDRPRYRPGQVVKLRALLRRPPTMRPVAGAPLQLQLIDPQGGLAHQTTATTSAYGIAAAELPLRPDARLGGYRLRVTPPTGSSQRPVEMPLQVAVERRPSLAIEARLASGRRYVLAGKPAALDVDARYLFGEPVAGGQVRLRWADGQTAGDGRLDASGHARLALRLPSLGAADGRDLALRIEVEDPTRHVERRWLPLRLARVALQLELLALDGAIHTGGAPQALAVSTTRPDGEPVDCRIHVSGAPLAAGTRTGPLGLARLMLPLRQGLIVTAEADDGARVALRFEPREHRRSAFLLRTERARYTVGEALTVRLRGRSDDTAPVLLDLVTAGRTVQTHRLTPAAGKAQLALPLTGALSGRLTLVAYRVLGDSAVLLATREVQVRPADALRIQAKLVDARSGRTAPGNRWRPATALRYELLLTGRDGQPVVGAISAAIVDRGALLAGSAPPPMDAGPGASWTRQLPRELLEDPRVAPATRELAAEVILVSDGPPFLPTLAAVKSNLRHKLTQASRARQRARAVLKPMIGAIPLVLALWALVAWPELRHALLWIAAGGLGLALIAAVMRMLIASGFHPFALLVTLMLAAVTAGLAVTWQRFPQARRPLAVTASALALLVVALPFADLRSLFWTSSQSLRSGNNNKVVYDSTIEGDAHGARATTTEDLDDAGSSGGAPAPASVLPTPKRPAPGGREMEPDPRQRRAPRVRRRFVDTLVWAPQIVTDGAGRAILPVRLDDRVTAWQTRLDAVDAAGRLGSLSTGMVATQALIVRPTVPAALSIGDRFELPVAIFAPAGQGTSALTLTATAVGDGLRVSRQATPARLSGVGPLARRVEIVAIRPGTHRLRFVGRTADGREDAVEVSVVVRPEPAPADPDGPLTLEVDYGGARLTVGSATLATIRIGGRSSAPCVLALALPAGLEPAASALEALGRHPRVQGVRSDAGRWLIELRPGGPVTLRLPLRALHPMKGRTPASELWPVDAPTRRATSARHPLTVDR